MLHHSTTQKQVENQQEDTYGIDFLYKQIKELWDQIEEYHESVGNLAESRAIVKGFIIEKKNKEGFVLFKNDKLFVSAIDLATTGKESLKLEIHIKSPIINTKYNTDIETKRLDLNVSDIEKFIKESLEQIELKEVAIENNYNINEENKIEKVINFTGGGEDSIALLRAEVLKLYENINILTVNQVNLNTYDIICKKFQFTIRVVANHLVILGSLENILKIEKIYPSIESIITKNKELFGVKDSQDVQEETVGGIKKLFSFGGRKKEASILEVGDKKLNELIHYIGVKITFLNKFKSNIESGFLDDLDKFDEEIRDDVKDIALIIIEDILSLSEGISGNIDSKKILYITHLINIFLDGITNGHLVTVYQYIINNEDLNQKYGEKIKAEILENYEYKKSLFSQVFSCGATDYYEYSDEKEHDIIFSEDSMQIVSTTSEHKLKAYNIILYKEQSTENLDTLNKKECKRLSKNGKYLLTHNKNFLDNHSQRIHDLIENTNIKLNKNFSSPYNREYSLHNQYLISVLSNARSDKYFRTYNMETDTEHKIDMPIGIDMYCINGDSIYFFEIGDNKKPTNFNSYNLSNGKTQSLNYIMENGETAIDVFNNDNKLFVVVINDKNELFLRSIDIENGKVLSSSISNYDISGLKYICKPKHIHVSNDGYILLQSKNDIYIINTNTNLIYKYTPTERINHLFKLHFVKNNKYGHFAVCRDGNQVHKIDIGLIENLIQPVSMEKVNKGIKEEEQKKEEKMEQDIKEGKIIKLEQGTEASKEGLKNLGERELQRETVAELRETRAINTMILQELKLLREDFQELKKDFQEVGKENQEMKEKIEGITKGG